jgi:hypothetical protein
MIIRKALIRSANLGWAVWRGKRFKGNWLVGDSAKIVACWSKWKCVTTESCGRGIGQDIFMQGQTVDELYENIREAVGLHFEGTVTANDIDVLIVVHAPAATN